MSQQKLIRARKNNHRDSLDVIFFLWSRILGTSLDYGLSSSDL